MDILDVGATHLTWRRLWSYLQALRWTRESAFWRALDPDGDGLWTVSDFHLANVVDLLAAANWQRSEDGAKGRNKPKPVKRPGEKDAANAKAELIKKSIAERKRRRAQSG